MCKHTKAMEIWGHAPTHLTPGNLEAMRLRFLGQNDAVFRPDDRVPHPHPLWHFALYSTGKPQPLQLRLARLIIRLKQ